MALLSHKEFKIQVSIGHFNCIKHLKSKQYIKFEPTPSVPRCSTTLSGVYIKCNGIGLEKKYIYATVCEKIIKFF